MSLDRLFFFVSLRLNTGETRTSTSAAAIHPALSCNMVAQTGLEPEDEILFKHNNAPMARALAHWIIKAKKHTRCFD